MTFGSLFSGVGGMDLGLERAGLRCTWQVEISGFCRRVLARHWPEVIRWDDVHTFPPEPAERWRVDLICGGDPCQENSRARVTSGTRAPSLGDQFLRVVDVLRPRLVLRENPARVRRDAPWPWWRFRGDLERLGYVVLPFRLRACCLGAHHQRDRLFLLAELAGPPGEAPERERVRPDDRAMGGGLVCHAGRERLAWLDGAGQPAEHAGRTAGGGVWGGGREDGLPTPRVCRGRHEVPDYVERIRALGNAVYPDVAEWIGRRILEADGGLIP